MSQIRKSLEWLRVQWNAGSGGKRFAIVAGLLVLWPFVLMFGLVALVFEIIASLDRGAWFSTKAQWAIATLLVVGGLIAVGAASPDPEQANAAEVAAVSSPAAVEASVATATPSVAPTSTPAAKPTPAATATPTAPPAAIRNVTGKFTKWEPVDDKRGYAYFAITNHGSEPVTAKCLIKVSNDFGNFGFDSLMGEEIAPGKTLRGRMAIGVGEGSYLINEGEVTDC